MSYPTPRGGEAVMPQKLAPCGTPSAYDRHRRNSEPIDDACRKANTEAKAAQGHTKVRDHARAELARRYPDELAELAAAHGKHPRRWDKARAELARRHEVEFRRLLTDEFTRRALEG